MWSYKSVQNSVLVGMLSVMFGFYGGMFWSAIFPTDPVQEKIAAQNKQHAENRARMYVELEAEDNCQ